MMQALRWIATILWLLAAPSLWAQSQIFVNQVWESTFGLPNKTAWADQGLDTEGNLFYTGHHTLNNTNTQLTLGKKSPAGNDLWSQSFQVAPHTQNFGLVLRLAHNGNIYLAGISSNDGSSAQYNILLISYDSIGNKLWHHELDGPAQQLDLPTDLLLDDETGRLYLSAWSTGLDSQLDFLTMSFDSHTGNLIWQKRYDHQNLQDLPGKLSFDLEGNITLVGTSAQTPYKWDITILKYTPTGTLLTEKRIPNASLGIERPADLTKDNAGNFFLTGTSNTGDNTDIKTIKLDNNLNVLWTSTYNGAALDSVAAIQVAPSGQLLLTGWQSNALGGTNMLLLCYDPNGELLWSQIRGTANEEVQAKAQALILDSLGNIFVAGEERYQNESTLRLLQYNAQGKLKWAKQLTAPNASQNQPLSLLLSPDQTLVLNTRVKQEGHYHYHSYKLAMLTRSLETLGSTMGSSSYLANELILRFQPNIINHSFLEDPSQSFSTIARVINDEEIIQAFENNLGVSNFASWSILKIHPNRRPTEQFTQTRLAKTVPIPDFYNTLLLLVPKATLRGDALAALLKLQASDNLNGYLKYAELNHILSLDNSLPNDSLYHTQANLHPNDNYQTGHINIEPAWCIAGAGNPNVKLAILDSGVRWSHEDFGDGSFAGSVVFAGRDYETGDNIAANKENDISDHGTKVASVAGALRNNGKGVAGIAGGTGNQDGIGLVAQRVFFPGTSVSVLLQALAEAYLDYGVDLINISGGYDPSSLGPWDNLSMRELIHQLNRWGVIISASRGNSFTDTPRLPATIQDDWVMCVGGTNTDGNYNDACRYGKGIDFAAPSRWQLTRTAQNAFPITGIPSDEAYGGISGTSGAAPHATGLAALMLGYASTTFVPEDIEYLLQASATDLTQLPTTPGYDSYTGFGRLNAGEAVALIEEPNCKVFHFGTDTDIHSRSSTLITQDLDVFLTEPITTEAGENFNIGFYKADVYKIVVTVAQALPSEFHLTHAWERHSSATVLGTTTAGQLKPVEKVVFTNTPNNLEATLEGYVYYLKNANSTAQGWLPANPEKAILSYSVLACQTVGTDKSVAEASLKLFPNPTKDLLHISFDHSNFESLELQSIAIVDLRGRLLWKKELQQSYEQGTSWQIETTTLSPGLYNCIMQTDQGVVIEKFVKL